MKFQGDIKLTTSPYSDGGINYNNGQPDMTGGFHTAITISLGTKTGWWGNKLFARETQKIGAKYDEVQGDIINNAYLRRKEAEAVFALNWMKKLKLAKKIESETTNPIADRMQNNMKITKPDGLIEIYQINWDEQIQEG